jgi:WD40 repeat protein
VTEVRYSPDGRQLVTGSWNGLRLWDADTGRPLTEWLETGNWVRSACFDPAGRRIATGAKGSRVWEIPPAPVPVPAWFPAFVEAVAGIRLGPRGNSELVYRGDLDGIVQQEVPKDPNDYYVRLAAWFLEDPRQRQTSPF